MLIESADEAFIQCVDSALHKYGIHSTVYPLGPDETGAARYGIEVPALQDRQARLLLNSSRAFLDHLHVPLHVAELLKFRADNLSHLGSLLTSKFALSLAAAGLALVAIDTLLRWLL